MSSSNGKSHMPISTVDTIVIENGENAVSAAIGKWDMVSQNPEEYLEQSNCVYVAGGALPIMFGKDNPLWLSMKVAAAKQGNNLEVAGVLFSLDELSMLGEFYRWIQNKGKLLHCIDERLDEEHPHATSDVHEHCGACAALQATLQKTNDWDDASVEDYILEALNPFGGKKQPLIAGTESNHESLRIAVDITPDGRRVRATKRKDMRMNASLSFNVSMPVSLINQWLQEKNQSDKQLQFMTTLMKWNAQIAANIITGHNVFKSHAAESQIVILHQDNQSDAAMELERLLKQVVFGSEQKPAKAFLKIQC